MTAVTTLPRSRPYTYDDLEHMPEDGHRYEVLDGTLLVTPAPVTAHQRSVGRLFLALSQACPAGLEVFTAPFDVKLAEDTGLQPDVLVCRTVDLTSRNLPGPPLLAVEVLCPSTRLVDLTLKRARHEQAGTAAYWVVDPDPEAPRLTAWELRDGVYVEVARLLGEETAAVSVPFEISLRPSALVRVPQG
jgi:Uma2 family endonuclease